MKLKPANSIFPILVMGLFMCLPAIAQEERTQMEIEAMAKEFRTEPDPVDPESKTSTKPATSTRDSVSQIKAIKPITKTSDKTTKQEDPLSFNFLYYIIEKFKMSDMIE
jgi:hypothetical protein